MLVALLVATFYWWDVTRHRMTSRYFSDIEVRFVNLKPSLRVVSKHPRVSVTATGPSVLQDLKGGDFIMRVDLADIQDATMHQVVLDPEGFVPTVMGLSADEIRVRQEDIFPNKIEVETEWNAREARLVPRYRGTPALGYIISATWVNPATITVAGSDADLARYRTIRNRNELVIDGESGVIEQVWTVDDLEMGNLEVVGDPKPNVRFKVYINPFFQKKLVTGVPIQIVEPSVAAPQAGIEHSVDPTSVDLVLQGARTKVESITANSLTLELDPSQFPPGEQEVPVSRLSPVNLPAGVQILQATPPSVKLWVGGPHELGTVFRDLWREVRSSYLSGNPPSSSTGAIQILENLPTAIPLSATPENKP
ncbi:MAG: hypothetical protein HUU16_13540 [Candidatus Omnitrophica bacterium]|nr:hypothetical protein [bacterium]NUN97185.1 hypothetical protein [Candidatus Omnitrophota bacterium]